MAQQSSKSASPEGLQRDGMVLVLKIACHVAFNRPLWDLETEANVDYTFKYN